jgi:hypothetical protein
VATATLVHTFTGSETYAPFASGVLAPFTGTFTIHAVRTGTNSNSMNVDVKFFNAGATVCWQQSVTWTAGTSDGGVQTFVVGTPSANWACTNWTGWSMQYDNLQFTPQSLGSTITLTLTYTPLAPPVPCAYGTRITSTTTALVMITEAMINAVLTAVGAPWLAFLFWPLIGLWIETAPICGQGPPTPPTITPLSLLEAIGDKLQMFQTLAWFTLCECVPGTPSPTPFPPPTLTKPTGWPNDPVYTCDPNAICATLTQILKRLDQLSTSQQINVTSTNTIVTRPLPLAYKVGASHTVSGEGSVTVAHLVGVRVRLDSAPPGKALPGTPDYLWNLGWMSLSDGGAMLQEKRITRALAEWFPLEAELASTLGYWLYPGMSVTLTELTPV